MKCCLCGADANEEVNMMTDTIRTRHFNLLEIKIIMSRLLCNACWYSIAKHLKNHLYELIKEAKNDTANQGDRIGAAKTAGG